MHFASPAAFALLILLPLYALWSWRRQRKGLPFSALSLFAEIRRPRPWRQYMASAALMACFVLAVVALARPQAGREVVSTTQSGIDIMLAFDTSASMLAQDFQPNRLEAAREVVLEFIRSQESNRVGVVVFSGRAFTLMPLTADYHLLQDAVAELHYEMVREPGTAIGDAIANALYRFREENTESRVIILLTDGENTAGNTQPIVAAQMARQQNVRVHVIGMGKPEGAPVPVMNPRTGRQEYLRDARGNVYLTRINEDELKQIASLTGGLYFRADNQASLKTIYAEIAKMDTTEYEVSRRTLYSERMHWFLLPALILLVLALALRWSGRPVLELDAR